LIDGLPQTAGSGRDVENGRVAFQHRETSMRPAGEAGPISRNRNPANGEVEADSTVCVNPTGDHKSQYKDRKKTEGSDYKARVRHRIPPDKNWIVDESTEG